MLVQSIPSVSLEMGFTLRPGQMTRWYAFTSSNPVPLRNRQLLVSLNYRIGSALADALR